MTIHSRIGAIVGCLLLSLSLGATSYTSTKDRGDGQAIIKQHASSSTNLPEKFLKVFADSTMRLDFTFSGKVNDIHISLDEIHLAQGWHGRAYHTDRLELDGTGRITMRSSHGDTIYRHAFSSLFQEWLATDEAQSTARSYENVYLVPYPRERVYIDVELEDVARNIIAQSTFVVDPEDILIRKPSKHTRPRPHYYLHKGDRGRETIDVVILGEGYTANEMQQFLSDAKRATEEILRYQPFAELKPYFNFIAVETPSEQTGVSTPRLEDWRKTAFGAHFDTFYSDRYLTTRRVKDIHNALLGIPYEHIIILANTDVYGGGGIFNSYTLTSVHHRHFLPVLVHEFGHSFGGLADEYFYEEDTLSDSYSKAVEPWEANVTNLIDFEGKKWSDLISPSTPRPTPKTLKDDHPIGLYEGAAYSTKGMYRASYDCRMRTNTYPTFCPVCQRALRRQIIYHTYQERD